MNQTPNAQRPMPNVELPAPGATSNIKPRTSNILWRIFAVVVGAIFIFAGLTKILEVDYLVSDLQHLRFVNAFDHLRHLSFADPAEFAHGITNFQILPWSLSVPLAFYLPWLEILCGVGLVFRFFYRGALCILCALIVVFTLATTAAKVRGLDITCGCFGHASQHWSFPAHLATNLGILVALLALWFQGNARFKTAN